MPHARYFIVRNQDAWVIKFNDEEYGPYNTQSEAMMFAVDAAQKLKRYGDSAEVCLVGFDGHFRQEWPNGHNAEPPRL